MMVTAASDSNMNVINILSTLQSKISSKDDRIKAYTNFSNHMKEDELSLFNLDVAKHADEVWSILQLDIMSDQSLLAHSALQVLGFFLHDSDNVGSLSATNVGNVISVLTNCVSQTDDKTTCTRALWCLSRQNLPSDVVNKNVSMMLNSAEFAMEKWKLQSITVENEASNIIARLLEVCPKEMINHIVQWGKILLVQLVHSAIKIREKALEVVNTQLSSLMTEQKVLSKFLMTDFNKKFGAEMERLFGSRHEIHVLKTWGILVQILGDDLHRGSFINHVLPIAELGFKSSNPEVKCLAFQAWQQLIDNFATNNAILTDPKRIKLVMQVFKLNNAKSENVALTKLQVWWHFIWLLGPKVSAHFDQVCVPLLHFCLGGGKLNNHLTGAATPRTLKTGTSPITPQMNLSVLGSSSAPPVIPALQLKGCEILAHILGSLPSDLDFPRPNYTMDPLSHEIITGPSCFYKHANLLVNSTTEIICSLSKKVPEALLYQVWYSLLAHMKNALEHLKLDMREILTSFLTQFQIIILSQALPQKVLLKMFEVVCCLPRKSLTSTAYNVGNGERIHGTPALFLTELLLTPVLLTAGTISESYMALFGILVDCGISTSSGSLEFCNSTLRMLEQNREFVEIQELMWRLWSSMVNPLHEHIKKTNEVNQGDALEHNFNCLYAVLVFPVQQGLVTSMPQASVKTLLKTWCDVYKTFARLSALVTNADANVCCEELCHRLLKHTSQDHLEEVGYLDFVSQCCLAMVTAVDFSSLGSVPSFNLNGLSPAKWAKKKQKPMDNIQSLVMLSQQLLEATLILAVKGESGKKPGVGSLSNTASVMVDVLTQLFTHVSTSNIIYTMIGHLAQPIADLFQGSAGKTTTKIYTNVFQQKLEKLWQTITNSVQSKFTSKADSELLAKLSPLLEATFLHPRRAMKNMTTSFWKAEFSQSAPLVYPESLKPVLCKVKEKTSIILPGWSAVDISVVEETPVSQMSQAESQAPEPRLPGMPSPVKMHGSFLNKAVSPHIKKSPAKPVVMEKGCQEVAKRDLLSVNGMKNDDFVVIKSPLKKKRILTEHQKEVFREKKTFPAMFNTLDLSQDVSLMASQFGNENTQNGSQLPSSDSVIVLGSSGSLGSQSNMNQADSMKATREENLANTDTKLMKKPGKLMRRRSVRFRDSDKQDEVDSVERTSVDDIESRSIDHFSVIQQAIGQTEDALKSVEKSSLGEKDVRSSGEKSVEKSSQSGKDVPSSGEKSIEKSSQIEKDVPTSGEKSVEKSSQIEKDLPNSGEKSVEKSALSEEDGPLSEESVVIPSLPQNPLGVIGLFEQLSSKSLSLESKKSEESSTSQKGDVEEGMEGCTTSENKSSRPLLSWTNKLTALSQSPLSTSQRQVRSETSPDRSLSPESLTSSQEKTCSPQKKSPRKGKISNSSGQAKLDKWFSQPSLSKRAGKAVTKAEVKDSTQSSQVVTVIEETQSPIRHGSKEEITEKGTIESPPHHNRQAGIRGSHKKLFGGDSRKEMEDFMEDSNIIPASPPKLRSQFSRKIGTPVLMLKRLTDDEIKQFSPTRKKHSSQNGDEETAEEQVPQDSSAASDELHEHDDFSEIRPLDSEDVIPSSQGFNTLTGDTVKSETVDSDKSQNQDIAMEKSCVKDISKKGNSIECSESDEDIEMAISDPEPTSLSETKDDMDDLNTYDPGLDSTFKDCTSATPKMFDVKNLDKEESVQTDSADSQEEIKSASEDSNKSYDPKEVSTMASDVPTPGRGRKRKQTSPMHMSPDSIKPKRIRRVPKKYSNFDEITFEAETKVQRTPKSGTPRSSRRPKQSPQTKAALYGKVETGPIQVKVDIHVSPDKTTEPLDRKDTEVINQDEHINDSDISFNVNSLKEKLQKGAIEINECLQSKRTDVTASEDMGISDKVDQEEMSDKMDKNPELEELISEKTPEGRSSRSTPHRKSTSKTKKEVIQKRARQMEKTIIINSGLSNLDSDSSEGDSCVSKIVSASESQADAGTRKISGATESQTDASSTKISLALEFQTDANSLKVSEAVEYQTDALSNVSPKKNISESVPECGMELGDSLDNFDVLVIESSDNDNTLKVKEKEFSETENGVEECVTDKDGESSINTTDIPDQMDAQDDIPLSFLRSNGESDSNRVKSDSDDDDVPLIQIKSKGKNKGEEITKESDKLNEIEKDDVVDLTESEEFTEKKTSRRIGEKTVFTTTRSQTLLTRSGSKRRMSAGVTNKRDNKNLSLKKTARQKKQESKEENSDKSCEENITNSTNTGIEMDMETPEPLGNKSQETTEINNSKLASEDQSECNVKSSGKLLQDKEIEEESSKNQNQSIRNVKSSSKLLQDKGIEEESDNNNDKNFELAESPVIRQENDLDETPRKIPDKTFVPSGCTLFESHSDTKLMSASRKFDKSRHVVARRSILKQPSPSQNSVEESSPVTGKRFHPIKVGNVHSPSASPSAGILKKRRLSGDTATNSPSPPGKRRVCFAHPLTMEQEAQNLANQESGMMKTDSIKSASPLVTASRVTFSSEKYFTVPGSPCSKPTAKYLPMIMSPSAKHLKKSLPVNPSPKLAAQYSSLGGKDSQLTPTQNSYRSTQESQLNSTDPIYPELLECSEKVDKILPQLTTSMWMRGLGQLVRARNIHTIGDLSALTEREVDNLPIKSPKVSIVRSVLQKFGTQKEARKVKNQKLDTTNTVKKDKVPIEGDVPGEESLSPLKKPVTDHNLDGDMPILTSEKDGNDVDHFTTNSHDMLDKVVYVEGLQASDDPSDTSQSAENSESAAGSLLNSLENIVRQCNDKTRMREFKTADIFQIHHHLTNLTATVMNVLKDRCQCPDPK
ncbi:telomere-associated protein RIF1-like isoform X2 [Mizuhopecten yessoensis]|uniref:Telomere-associated protein RIF1 n=1 Tax=Mizuhopecten yessoensis TaxID=6573 RepID=A0A210QGH5_MIZYE|nr:telomere-associated protein RIF1-like isoform X2 [Mizuhopecten yessoensis]OWF47711.1 Telomere-associated protein RIF1 [Mizuhopecten yessoensis]